MWIFTKRGFLSIVAHRDDNESLLVRARMEGDLEALFPGCRVEVTPGADYRFRTTLSRRDAAQVIAAAIEAIDYPNFKNAIPPDRPDYHEALFEVWGVMLDLQQKQAHPNRDRKQFV